MSIDHDESLEHYTLSISLSDNNWKFYVDEYINQVKNIDKEDVTTEVIIYHFCQMDSQLELGKHNAQSIEELIKNNGDDEDDEDTTIKLITKKSDSQNLVIYSPFAFINGLKNKKITKQIKFFLDDIRNIYNSVTLPNISFDIPQHNCDEFSNKSEFLKDHFDIYSCEIEYFNSLMVAFESESIFKSYLLDLRTIISLASFSKKFNLDKLCFTFENEKSLEFDNESDGFFKEKKDIIYKIYRWAYCDDRSPTRIGIINLVVSKYQDLKSSFVDEIISTLESNYKIYIANNFDQYVEVMSKLSEFIHESTNKIVERTSESTASARNILILILSYFFTIIVFTGIDKGKVENIFNFEISCLSSLFIVGAIVNLFIVRSSIKFNLDLCEEQLADTLSRNSKYIGDDDKKAIESSKPLKKARDKADEEKVYVIIGIILSALLLLVWSLYYFKSDSAKGDVSKAKQTITTQEKRETKPINLNEIA